MLAEPVIRRRFADLAHGQVHYREAGEGDALLLLHGSPGSSRQLVRLIARFAPAMRVIAPDTPGNGDSEPLPIDAPTIANLAAVALEFMDRAGIASAHVYGSHTGSAIGAELALLAPDRVRSLVYDGVGHWEGEVLADILANYAHPFTPDTQGEYLKRALDFCQNQYLFYPWYRRVEEARRTGGLPPAEDFHALFIEVMKAATTFHRNYRAAFQWNARGRLPLVTCPALFMASVSDPLFEDTAALAGESHFTALPPLTDPAYSGARQAAMTHFFATEV
ncbi:alpha/beta fold hydrolase [Novosphingobium sp.]|uniref:alpha/beta fold hydrolase n=1 Tax=Novosphingobium sp. TaxID=1874826 RepID=UPI00286E863C|nr:alpha/beta fold hydrolase [Novosphingobium sp.]